MPMPVGTFPTQDTAKETDALKPPSEFTIKLVPPLDPGIVETVSAVGVIAKSPTLIVVTGARTAGMLTILTGILVELDTAPLEAMTRSV